MTPLRSSHAGLLHDALARASARAPDKIALHTETASCSYAELDDHSNRLATALVAQGLRRGDRVAIFMDNTIACAVSIYGVSKAGGVFVVVNPQTKQDKLRYIANDCAVRHIVTDTRLAEIVELVASAVPSLKSIVVAGAAEDISPSVLGIDVHLLNEITDSSGRAPAPAAGTVRADLAALIYTSGSTGNPKGVMQTHASMVFAATSISEYLGLQPHDVLLNVLPMAFDYGLYQLLLSISVGATLVLERSFTYPTDVFARMTKHGVTTFPGVPTIFRTVAASHKRKRLNFPGITRVTNTADALASTLVPTIREIFPAAELFAMYGLTECKRVSFVPPAMLDRKPGSVGIAIPGTEVFLRSPEGDSVPAGTPGILHVRGPHLMRGYWNNQQQTDAMLIPGDKAGEKVLRTGDWFRTDDDGYLYFLSRSDDIIKTRGEKVSPTEVEAALVSIPGVHEAAVVGVPDELLGQAVRAVVVPSLGVTMDEPYLKRELMKRLENFMIPRDIVFRDALPKSPNGKVDRKRASE